MGINDFINNGIDTSKKIYEVGVNTMKQDNLNLLSFFGKALKDSSIGAFNVFLKAEIDSIIKRNEIERTKNDTSDKVAYLLGGYYLSPAILLNLKEELESQGVNVQIINERYYSKETIWKTARELRSKMKQDKGKDIVLFGYSAGGIIAHKFGEKHGYKSVSFGAPENPKETMVGTLVSLTKQGELGETKIPENGTNIVESFSAMVPSDKNTGEQTVRLQDVYSHMTIGKEEVVNEISKQILLGFDNETV